MEDTYSPSTTNISSSTSLQYLVNDNEFGAHIRMSAMTPRTMKVGSQWNAKYPKYEYMDRSQSTMMAYSHQLGPWRYQQSQSEIIREKEMWGKMVGDNIFYVYSGRGYIFLWSQTGKEEW